LYPRSSEIDIALAIAALNFASCSELIESTLSLCWRATVGCCGLAAPVLIADYRVVSIIVVAAYRPAANTRQKALRRPLTARERPGAQARNIGY